jgi:hypothetical protein
MLIRGRESFLLDLGIFLVLDDAAAEVLANDVEFIAALVKFLAESLSIDNSGVELLFPLKQAVGIEGAFGTLAHLLVTCRVGARVGYLWRQFSW